MSAVTFTAHLTTPAVWIVEPLPGIHNTGDEQILRSSGWMKLSEIAECAAYKSGHALPFEFFPLGSISLLPNFGYLMNDQVFFYRRGMYHYLTSDGRCFWRTNDLPSSDEVLVSAGWGHLVIGLVGKNVARVTTASVPGNSLKSLVVEFRDGSYHFLDRKKGAWNWKILDPVPTDCVIHS